MVKYCKIIYGCDIMPRMPRVKGENLIFHIIQRGNERKNIFRDDIDKHRYLEIFTEKFEEDYLELYGYCLMDNHVHLLLKVFDSDISNFMKKVNVSYVMYFNNRHKRYGNLFQNRFKSEIVNDDSYLLQASKYIHNNPVKAGMVSSPEEYKWSSYGVYIGACDDTFSIVNSDKILSILPSNNNTKTNAIGEYINFVRLDSTFDSSYRRFVELESKKEIKELDFKIASNILNGNYSDKKKMIINFKNRTSLTTREIGHLLDISASTVSRILKNH